MPEPLSPTHDRYFDNVAGWILELIEEKGFRGKEIILGWIKNQTNKKKTASKRKH
jgi:hypothetical protein